MNEHEIGGVLWSGGAQWRCTDPGARVSTAIKLGHENDSSRSNGPP